MFGPITHIQLSTLRLQDDTGSNLNAWYSVIDIFASMMLASDDADVYCTGVLDRRSAR